MTSTLLQRIVLPVASEADAKATARAAAPYVESDTSVSVVHVVEKAGGAPDKASVEQREELGREITTLVADRLAEQTESVSTEILYGEDIVETVVEHAKEIDATAVAFLPRNAGLLTRLLSGQNTVSMVTDTDLPVIVLPEIEEESDHE